MVSLSENTNLTNIKNTPYTDEESEKVRQFKEWQVNNRLGAGKVDITKIRTTPWQMKKENERETIAKKVKELQNCFIQFGLQNCALDTALPSAIENDWITSKLHVDIDGMRIEDLEEIVWSEKGQVALGAHLISLYGGMHRLAAIEGVIEKLDAEIETTAARITTMADVDVDSKQSKSKQGPSREELRGTLVAKRAEREHSKWWAVYFWDYGKLNIPIQHHRI